MARRKRPQDYSEDELRWHLHKRLRAIRELQIEHLRRSGKIVSAKLLRPANAAASAADRQGDDCSNPPDAAREHKSLRWRTLTIIEAGLIASLMLLVFSGLLSLDKVNQKTREIWQLPAVTPTPLVRPLLLPSGHTPASAAEAEDPRELLVHGYLLPQRNIPVIRPNSAPAAEFATRIQIPAIDVDAPIVQGVESEQLKKGVGQIPGTANPGQKGNLVLSAHNDIYGELFRYLDRLKSGDQFTVFTNLRAYTYIVTGWELVEPARVEVLSSTPDATATLISCYPYLIDTLRIVVKARLAEG